MIVVTVREKTNLEKIEMFKKAIKNLEFLEAYHGIISKGNEPKRKVYNLIADGEIVLKKVKKVDIARYLKVSETAVNNHLNGSKGKIHNFGYDIEEV